MERLFLLVVCAAIVGAQQPDVDPCDPWNHRSIDNNRRSTGYMVTRYDQGLCDSGLIPGWYRFTSAAGGKLAERCPRRGQCGTTVPIWINQTHPAVGDGPVGRHACAYLGSVGDGSPCTKSIMIGVKNCGQFFVYYLSPTFACPMAYCAGDKPVCSNGKLAPGGRSSNCPGTNIGGSGSVSGGSGSSSAGNSSTSGGSHSHNYPVITTPPSLKGPEILGHSFRFTCDVNYKEHRSDLMLEVQWTFDGQSDPNIPNIHIADPGRQAHLPGSSLKGHLGKEVGCQVRAWYQNGSSTVHRRDIHPSPWLPSQNTYFAGIRTDPHHVRVSKAGGGATVTLNSTIPVVCDHHYSGTCCVWVSVQVQGGRNIVQVPHSCSHPLCTSDWDPQTSTASITIPLQAVQNGVPHGDTHLQATFNPLTPVGGGMYLNAFANYTIPPVEVRCHDSSPKQCVWTTDPHFHGFDRQSFHLYGTGDFTVYENPMDNFEVQARAVRCAGQTSCQCGVAIREHNDVIRISNCGLGSLAPKVEVNHQPLRAGTVIRRSSDGKNILVQMPSGRSVKVDVQRGWHAATLTVPASDASQGGRGLCGSLVGGTSQQFVHRDGHVDTNPCSSSSTHHSRSTTCIPVKFYESWKNDQSHSLFYDHPTSTPPTTSQPQPHQCQCDAGATSSQNHNTCSPPVTSPTAQCTGTCHTVTSSIPPWVNAHWVNGKRDVSRLYLDRDEPDPPVDLTETSPSGWQASWPTAGGITWAEANDHCQRELGVSQLFPYCRHMKTILDFSLDSCVLDILFSDGYNMTDANVAGFTSNCQFAMTQDINNYVTDSQGNLVLKSHVTEVCSVDCLRHGRCVRGKCVCYAGYTGDNCQLQAGKAPVLHRVRGSSMCDVIDRPCRMMYMDADQFQFSDRFACSVQTLAADGSADPSQATQTEAHFITDNRLACSLPQFHLNTGRPVVKVAISVTCNGSLYSNALRFTIYNSSSCVVCSDGTCTSKAHYCLIDDACYQDGDVNVDDATKRCTSTVSSSHWSSTELSPHTTDGAATVTVAATELTSPSRTPPHGHVDLGTPTLRGMEDMLVCTVHLLTHVPGARYEVTWLVDEGEVAGMKTVLSANQSHVYITTQDLPQGGTAMCQVRALYEGGDSSDPQLSNAMPLHVTDLSLDG